MKNATARHCACSARLPHYNTDSACGACERDARDSQAAQTPPPALPRDPRQAAVLPDGTRAADRDGGLQPESP